MHEQNLFTTSNINIFISLARILSIINALLIRTGDLLQGQLNKKIKRGMLKITKTYDNKNSRMKLL